MARRKLTSQELETMEIEAFTKKVVQALETERDALLKLFSDSTDEKPEYQKSISELVRNSEIIKSVPETNYTRSNVRSKACDELAKPFRKGLTSKENAAKKARVAAFQVANQDRLIALENGSDDYREPGTFIFLSGSKNEPDQIYTVMDCVYLGRSSQQDEEEGYGGPLYCVKCSVATEEEMLTDAYKHLSMRFLSK